MTGSLQNLSVLQIHGYDKHGIIPPEKGKG